MTSQLWLLLCENLIKTVQTVAWNMETKLDPSQAWRRRSAFSRKKTKERRSKLILKKKFYIFKVEEDPHPPIESLQCTRSCPLFCFLYVFLNRITLNFFHWRNTWRIQLLNINAKKHLPHQILQIIPRYIFYFFNTSFILDKC